MALFKNSNQSPLRPFKEKCCQNFERLSQVRVRRNSVDSSNVGVRALENLNKGFSRHSSLNLSARKVAKKIEQVVKNVDDKNSIGRDSPMNMTGRRDTQKLESMKNTLTKDINSIKEAIATISSPQNYKRKQSNIINEDRTEFAVVDLTIDLCDKIRQDDDEANYKEEVPNVKRRKFSDVSVND